MSRQGMRGRGGWWVVALLPVALLLWYHWAGKSDPLLPEGLSRVVLPIPRPLQPFSLLDQEGEPFALAQLKGRWTFLFFGYTRCPDVCPTAMAVLGELFRRLQETPLDLANSQALLVTVDPARDTPPVLKPYVTFFNPSFKGLTGSSEQILALSRQLGAAYFVNPAPPSDAPSASAAADPSIGHTSSLFLIDPLGRHVALFTGPHEAGAILEEYAKIRHFVRSRTLYAEPEHNR
ncbi:MAG: SCO family protein [Magnetococcales bacterium]|nr:SCO family protein [Magnetococcales bacterium]